MSSGTPSRNVRKQSSYPRSIRRRGIRPSTKFTSTNYLHVRGGFYAIHPKLSPKVVTARYGHSVQIQISGRLLDAPHACVAAGYLRARFLLLAPFDRLTVLLRGEENHQCITHCVKLFTSLLAVFRPSPIWR